MDEGKMVYMQKWDGKETQLVLEVQDNKLVVIPLYMVSDMTLFEGNILQRQLKTPQDCPGQASLLLQDSCEGMKNRMRKEAFSGAPKTLADGGDATTPTLYISQKNGNQMQVKIENGPPTNLDYEVKYTLGEEFEENPSDGRKNVRSVVTYEKDKLVYVQKWDGKECTAVRDVMDGKLVVTLTCGDVVAVRRYKKSS